MKRNAQAAMEFLMTYGWALLVVLAAIAALAYFGVLSPQKFMPEQCVLSPGIACLDFKITSTDTTLIISNSLGKDLIISEISVGNCSSSLSQTLANGNQAQFILTGCDNGDVGVRFKQDITIEYTSDSGLDKTLTGTIAARIQ